MGDEEARVRREMYSGEKEKEREREREPPSLLFLFFY